MHLHTPDGGFLAIKKIVVASHAVEDTTGWDDELVVYAIHRGVKEVAHLQFPFLFSRSGRIRLTVRREGTTFQRTSLIAFYRPQLASFAKDFLCGLWLGWRVGRTADLFVGLNNLTVAIGLVLRACGVVKRVAYTVVDYTPVRFANPISRVIYRTLDRVACHHADVVWPLHSRMIEGRAEHGVIDPTRVYWQEAPYGNHSERYADADHRQHRPATIVYLGGVVKSKGAELFAPILRQLVTDGLADCRFECIGGGDVEYLKQELDKHGLRDRCRIHGRVADMESIGRILLSCGVAIAPYYPHDRNSFSYYADPGKIKDYLGCGLPVVLTAVPPIAATIARRECGLVAEYDPADFATKIKMVVADYARFQKNATAFGRQSSWRATFDTLFAGPGPTKETPL